MSRPRQVVSEIQRWEEEQWMTAVEPRLAQVNNSPTKSFNYHYLTSEDKKDFKLNGII